MELIFASHTSKPEALASKVERPIQTLISWLKDRDILQETEGISLGRTRKLSIGLLVEVVVCVLRTYIGVVKKTRLELLLNLTFSHKKVQQPIYSFGQHEYILLMNDLGETTTKCPWKSVRESTKISGDTSSEQSFSCAIDWIEDCKRSHRTCTVSTTGVLPDRVLDLGFADFLSESPVKLYETKNENDDYVCLSYCWGKAQNLTTKKGNLQAHIKGLTWDVLPQTFRDAIIFTRRLKIRYLWIDSLCIIQDDNKDWQRQACKMPAIYENSYVTIAATASDSSTGGCFRKAEQRYKAQELSIEDRSGTTHKIFVRHHLPHWMSANPRYFGRHFEEFPIWNRGWIMQERLLAPRVIHFGRHELMWECTEAARCECSFLDHIGRDHEIDEDNSKLDKIRHYRSIAQDKEEKEETQLTRQSIYEASPPQRWRALVSKYSSLSLTMEKDIFPALAGLAKQWNRNVNDEYIAGMWKGNLPIDLLWQVMSPQKRKIEHSNWRAPSWSWAHDKYHVEWVNDLKNVCDPEIHLTVLDAGQTPTGEDMMGEISFAYLVGLATLCPGKLIIFPPAEHPQASLIIDREWINELPDPSATIYGMRTEIHLDRMMEPTCECKGREDRTVPMSGWDVYCMKVATLAFKEYSLILRYDPVSKTYTRCGILEEDVGPPVERRKGRVPWDSTSCVREIIALW